MIFTDDGKLLSDILKEMNFKRMELVQREYKCRRRRASSQLVCQTKNYSDQFEAKKSVMPKLRNSAHISRRSPCRMISKSTRLRHDTHISLILLLASLLGVVDLPGQLNVNQIEALRITNFFVPAFVPTNLAAASAAALSGGALAELSPELAKPILFDCDYEYSREEDSRLAVKWFKNKESEPFYQWLPELNVRHFADWIKPLVNVSFVANPQDPLKRFRSLLVKRLSLNLTGSYSCVVSSLAGQDMRESSLVVYAPPRAFTFEHRIYPAPAQLLPGAMLAGTQRPPPPPPLLAPSLVGGPSLEQRQAFQPNRSSQPTGPSPTQFRGGLFLAPTQRPHHSSPGQPLPTSPAGLPIVLVRPPNNHNHDQPPLSPYRLNHQSVPSATAAAAEPDSAATATSISGLAEQQQPQPPLQPPPTKIVYTHDGRPIRRKNKRQTSSEMGASWQLRQRLNANNNFEPAARFQHVLQLHHLQCQATQVYPRPVLTLQVKRQADSIAQYLHESSSYSIRPYQISVQDLLSQGPSLQPFANNNSTTTLNARHNNSNNNNKLEPLGPVTAMMMMQQRNKLNNNGSQLQQHQMLTVFDITVSATIALNVSLPLALAPASPNDGPMDAHQPSHHHHQMTNELAESSRQQFQSNQMQAQLGQQGQVHMQASGINTVLQFRRGQRMSFECHLEITGTDFERRQRIQINETEVFRLAELDELRRRQRARDWQQQQFELELQQQQQQQQQHRQNNDLSPGLLADLVGNSATRSALIKPRAATLGEASILHASLAIASTVWLLRLAAALERIAI